MKIQFLPLASVDFEKFTKNRWKMIFEYFFLCVLTSIVIYLFAECVYFTSFVCREKKIEMIIIFAMDFR